MLRKGRFGAKKDQFVFFKRGFKQSDGAVPGKFLKERKRIFGLGADQFPFTAQKRLHRGIIAPVKCAQAKLGRPALGVKATPNFPEVGDAQCANSCCQFRCRLAA
ncbi:MAG TPA: hypothetical protein VLR50_07690 [Desulfobacterales bacterium]|nr:hypothetical protein [Desulfobacterales bacterium]